jgi:hypothetical protein
MKDCVTGTRVNGVQLSFQCEELLHCLYCGDVVSDAYKQFSVGSNPLECLLKRLNPFFADKGNTN